MGRWIVGGDSPAVKAGSEKPVIFELPNLLDEMEHARRKAWDSLARYKFMQFGYWAAIWVHLNRISGSKKSNPFRDLVAAAKLRGGAR
jgi:hypothetical protein